MLGLACPPKSNTTTNKNNNGATIMTGGDAGHIPPKKP